MITKRDLYKKIAEYPFCTILMGIVAAVIYKLESASLILQYDRDAIAGGEFWRLIAGHWTHWNFDHFLWCTIVFVSLGGICEKFCRKGYLVTLLIASLIIPSCAWYISPELGFYRGLSGLGSSIFVFGAGWMMFAAYQNKNWPTFVGAAGAGGAFMAKVIFEYLGDKAVFVNSPDLFLPVPLVHLVGGAIGLIMLFVFWRSGEGQEIRA